MSATVNVSSIVRTQVGSKTRITGTLSYTTYQTGGPVILANTFDLDQIEMFQLNSAGGIFFAPLISTDQSKVNLLAFETAGGTPAGTISSVSAGTPAGTVTAPTFTGTALGTHQHSIPFFIETATVTLGAMVLSNPVSLPVYVFANAGTLTGQKSIIPSPNIPAAGQVAYDSGLVTLNFAAGDGVTNATVAYISNVSGLTSAGTPAGTNSVPVFSGTALAPHTHTFTGTAIPPGVGTQVPNATDLSGLGNIPFEATGL